MFALLLSGAHKVWGQRRWRCQAVIPRPVGLTSLPELSSLVPVLWDAGVVIAVSPPDLGQAEFWLIFLSHFEGRTLEHRVEVTALIALSTDISRVTPTRRRGELLTIILENIQGTLRPLLCAGGVPSVPWSCASSHKCFPTAPAWSKACFTPPSGTSWVSLGHAENRFLFGMLVWTRAWWKERRIN